MVRTGNQDLAQRFIDFYREQYRSDIIKLARDYPDEKRSLYIDYNELAQYDADIAADFRTKPTQMREYAEEALRLYELPDGVDTSLGRAHIRIINSPETINIRDIRMYNDHIGTLVSISGILHDATNVHPEVTEAAFECQRCGTMTYIPQSDDNIQEPNECLGCERQGPFRLNFDHSEFTDSQTLQLMDDPRELARGTAPEKIRVDVVDDLAGQATVGDRVRVTGVLHLEMESDNSQSAFTPYLDGYSIETADEIEARTDLPTDEVVSDLKTYVARAATVLNTTPESEYEQETRVKLITPFIEALGWNKYDSREVRVEYTDPNTSNRPDYALFGPDATDPDVIVEAKRLGKDLTNHETQLHEYLRDFSTEWGVLTNGTEFRVCHWRSNENESSVIAVLDLNDLPESNLLTNLCRETFYESTKGTISRVDPELFQIVHHCIADVEAQYGHTNGAPIETVTIHIEKLGFDPSLVENIVSELKQTGQITEAPDGTLQSIREPIHGKFGDKPTISTTDSEALKHEQNRLEVVWSVINKIERKYEEGASISDVVEELEGRGIEQSQITTAIEKLRTKGKVYEPKQRHLRTT